MDGAAMLVDEMPQNEIPTANEFEPDEDRGERADSNSEPAEASPAHPDDTTRLPDDVTDSAADETSEAQGTETITPVQIVEAILFAADAPLPASKIAQALGVGDARDVRKHVAARSEER